MNFILTIQCILSIHFILTIQYMLKAYMQCSLSLRLVCNAGYHQGLGGSVFKAKTNGAVESVQMLEGVRACHHQVVLAHMTVRPSHTCTALHTCTAMSHALHLVVHLVVPTHGVRGCGLGLGNRSHRAR